jgi:hypothetical protein
MSCVLVCQLRGLRVFEVAIDLACGIETVSVVLGPKIDLSSLTIQTEI